MIKIAVYCRVSTDKDDQANSFDNQKKYFKMYVDNNPDWELYDIYADEGLTGTSTKKRVQFNRMINDARHGKIDYIITKEVSRFSRNVLDAIQYTRELKSLNVGILFINDNIDTLKPEEEFRLSLMSMLAQEESRKTSDRVKWGQRRQMEKGVVFGRSMLGYDVKNGQLFVNNEGADIVRLIFQKYVFERKGTTTIARELREEGYKTYSGSPLWTNVVILRILKNEKYAGDLCQAKTYTPDYLSHEKKYNYDESTKIYIKNHHEPIIPRKIFDRAQEEIKRRNNNSNAKESSGFRYPLSGKIKCGECGSSFVARKKYYNDEKEKRIWRCDTATRYGKMHFDKAGNKVGCDIGKQISDDIALEIIKESIRNLNFDREQVIKKVSTVALSAINNYEEQQKYDVPKLENEKESLLRKKEDALNAFFDKTISKSDLKLMNDKYDSLIRNIEKSINESKKSNNLNYNKTEIEKDIINEIKKIVYDKTAPAEYYGNLVKKLTVFKDGKVSVELHFLPYEWWSTLQKIKNTHVPPKELDISTITGSETHDATDVPPSFEYTPKSLETINTEGY